jgi:hypothetical protein
MGAWTIAAHFIACSAAVQGGGPPSTRPELVDVELALVALDVLELALVELALVALDVLELALVELVVVWPPPVELAEPELVAPWLDELDPPVLTLPLHEVPAGTATAASTML